MPLYFDSVLASPVSEETPATVFITGRNSKYGLHSCKASGLGRRSRRLIETGGSKTPYSEHQSRPTCKNRALYSKQAQSLTIPTPYRCPFESHLIFNAKTRQAGSTGLFPKRAQAIPISQIARM